MTHCALRCFLGLIMACSAICWSADIPESVREAANSRVESGKTVGMVIAVVDAEGLVFSGYGKRDASGIEVPGSETVFEIGSISKVFTAILLADAVRRGEVKYQDEIQSYLPEALKVPRKNGKSIRLEHLSIQNSGLPRMPSNFSPGDRQNPYVDYDVSRLYEFIETVELERDIGESYEYSNVGVGLLGHLLERASGLSYEELVRQRIASVLEMSDTSITLSDGMRERLAKGHRGGREVSNWDLSVFAGAGGIRSTALDMVRFIQANLGLLDSPLLASMRETHRARASAGSDSMKIGLGWHIRNPDSDRAIYWHNGGTGGYRCFAGFVQDPPLGVVVLTNSGGKGDDDIGFHLLDESIPLVKSVSHEEVKVEIGILKNYVGQYELGPGLILDIELEGSQLSAQLTGQSRFPVFPKSETEFFYKVVEAQLTFDLNDSEAVTGLTLLQGGRKMPAKKLD